MGCPLCCLLQLSFSGNSSQSQFVRRSILWILSSGVRTELDCLEEMNNSNLKPYSRALPTQSPIIVSECVCVCVVYPITNIERPRPLAKSSMGHFKTSRSQKLHKILNIFFRLDVTSLRATLDLIKPKIVLTFIKFHILCFSWPWQKSQDMAHWYSYFLQDLATW